MKVGESVKLQAYGGHLLTRRVIDVKDNQVIVTTEEEFHEALRENRKPVSVGFNVKYVVKDN